MTLHSLLKSRLSIACSAELGIEIQRPTSQTTFRHKFLLLLLLNSVPIPKPQRGVWATTIHSIYINNRKNVFRSGGNRDPLKD